jgi:hypothetical protein
MNTNRLGLVAGTVAFIIVLSAQGATVAETDEGRTTEEIAALQKRIIPPKGTTKEDVDAVYGVPEEVKELKGKGLKTNYPMHVYELLPPRKKEDFRAFLYVTYRNGVVGMAGINHMLIKNRPLSRRQGPEADKQKMEIAEENLRVLANLKEIEVKFGDGIKSASWNKAAEQPNEPGRQ